jgi:hypothetical protein
VWFVGIKYIEVIFIWKTNRRNILNTNTKGNIALGKAISYFTENEYVVSIPLNDSQCYDLIIEKDFILKTVQVKYTSEKKNNGFKCWLKTTSGTSRKKIYGIKDKKVNFLFCYCSNGDTYLIPTKVLKNDNCVMLVREKSKYANKNTLDTSLYLIN